MRRLVTVVVSSLLLAAVLLSAAASAGRSAKQLDSDKGKGKRFTLTLKGTASPTGSFIVKATGKRGVRVTVTGLVICTTDGDTATDTNVDLRGRLPFTKAIRPLARENDSCSAGLSVDVLRQRKPVEVKAKLFNKP